MRDIDLLELIYEQHKIIVKNSRSIIKLYIINILIISLILLTIFIELF